MPGEKRHARAHSVAFARFGILIQGGVPAEAGIGLKIDLWPRSGQAGFQPFGFRPLR